MKKIILIALTFMFIVSCTDDENDKEFRYEILKVESFTAPASFTMGETAVIKVRYLRPTNCHSFDGFYYDRNLNIRTVAVQAVVFEEPNCQTLDNVVIEKDLNFKVTSNGTYVFKFYKGKDANGVLLFDEIEIPVN